MVSRVFVCRALLRAATLHAAAQRKNAMKRTLLVTTVAYTPQYCRPELFGSCQLRMMTPYDPA
jgi:hypothetical protein